MRNEIIAAARQIKSEIHLAEIDYDRTLANNASLAATLLNKRIESGAATSMGDDALDHVFEAITHCRVARKEMRAAHEKLARLNPREVGVGDVLECPDAWLSNGLTVVASADSRAA